MGYEEDDDSSIKKMIRRNFDKLSPADKLAIETKMQKAKKEEFEDAYKIVEGKIAKRNRPMSGGEVIFLIILFSALAMLFFGPIVEFAMLSDSVKGMGPDICARYNSTYVGTSFSPFLSIPTIKCSTLTIKYP